MNQALQRKFFNAHNYMSNNEIASKKPVSGKVKQHRPDALKITISAGHSSPSSNRREETNCGGDDENHGL